MYDEKAILQLRDEIFRRVAEAAKNGQTDQVARLASLAKNCDSSIETMKGLEAEVERIRKGLKDLEHPATNRVEISSLNPPSHVRSKGFRKSGSRERGREVREKWVGRALRDYGVRLRRMGEVTYQTASGKMLGIPYASEAPERTYPWWLGLPDKQPYYAVLLCETSDGQVLDFVLDHSCIVRIWGSLSRDANHHVKFHVRRSGPNWELKLKDGPVVQLNEYHRDEAPNILQ
jgi:hypothetical protein